MNIENNWCTLKIDNESMHALMCLHAPVGEEEMEITEECVREFLDAQKIVYGLSDVDIHAIANHIAYGQYVCVAQGKAPTKGRDGYYEFCKNMQDIKKKPLVMENGSVDYHNSLTLATISEGELLAVYKPPTDGEEGYDIFGNFLRPLGRGKDALPLRGHGIRPDEEKVNFYAEYSGHIVMESTHVSIEKLYRVSSDLDIEVGNIKFDGDVEVMGDVRSGMELEAKGSVFIHGHVGACKILAGDNITIEKGIQGRDNCYISAAGDIACKFVERCSISAKGNVYADSILNARVKAEKQVLVTTKTGVVVGSEVYGMTGVVIKEAGNEAGTPTLLRAGLPREEYARAKELIEKIAKIDKQTEDFNGHLETFGQLGHQEDARKLADTRTQIMRAKIVLASDRKVCQEELDVISERIRANAANSNISITGTIFAGVRIYLGDTPYLVNEAVKEVKYVLKNGAVLACGLNDKDTD